MRVALRNCGVINPEQIEEYIALDGYQAIGKILTEKIPPQQVIRPCSIPASAVVAVQASPPVLSGNSQRQTMPIRNMYVVTPTKATRARLWIAPFWKANPHAIIEAMAIAGYAIGASQGYIYIRAEYPHRGSPSPDCHQPGERVWPARQEYLRFRL